MLCEYRTEVDSFMKTNTNYSSIEEIAEVIDCIQSMIETNQFDDIGVYLNSIITEQTTTEVLIALLRVTFIWRNNIKQWSTFFQRVRIELSNRKLDVDTLLRGLC